jgi:putative ABC transport system permease protein
MIFADTGQLALRNLREAFLRTVLTALGVSIGIASLVGMVSFGVAFQDQVVGSLLRSGVFDSITVTSAPRAAPRGRGSGPGLRLQDALAAARQGGPRTPLDDEALKKMMALTGVKEAYPDVRVPVEARLDEASEFAAATGVPMSARGQGVFQRISFGQFFPNDSDDTCLISLEFAGRLSDADPKDLVGKTLTLAYAAGGTGESAVVTPLPGLNIQHVEKPFRIVGIVERQAGAGVGAGVFAAIMIPLEKAREMGAYDLSGPQALLRQMADRRTYTTVTVNMFVIPWWLVGRAPSRSP